MRSINKHVYFLFIIIAFICFATLKLTQDEMVETVSSNVEEIQAFLLYKDRLVTVPTSTASKKSTAKAEELIAYMKQGAAHFEQLLNEATQLNKIQLKKGVMTLYFDELAYQKKDELRVLEALIFACTQFDDVKSIQLSLKNQVLKEMPINHTPITNTTRSFGINHLQSNQIYLHEGEQILFYYEIEMDKHRYEVMQSLPVQNKSDYYEIMKLMFKDVNASSNLHQPLAEYKINLEKCELKKDVLHLYLNQNILDKNQRLKKKALVYIKKNLAQFAEIKYISIHVNDKVISEKGKNKISIR